MLKLQMANDTCIVHDKFKRRLRDEINSHVITGALVCMSLQNISVFADNVIICRRPCAEPGSGMFAVHFLPQDVTFWIHQWFQAPLVEEIDACMRQDRQTKMHSHPDRDVFCWTRDTVLLCAKS